MQLIRFSCSCFISSRDLKDEEEKNKKKDSEIKYESEMHPRKWKRTKPTGVYSVSDAMTKQLLPKRSRDRKSAGDCEKCLLRAQEMTNQRCPYGMYILGKSTSQCRRPRDTHSASSVRSEDHIQKQLRRTRRAHSSPEIIVSRRDPACTCLLGQRQNGDSALISNKQQNWISINGDKSNSKPYEDNCERTPECNKECCGCDTDMLHYEKETVQRLTEFETSYRNALRQNDGDHKCRGSSCSIHHSSEEVRNLLEEQRGGEVNTNGKVQRQLDDAFVRLENQPGVRIAVVAESIV